MDPFSAIAVATIPKLVGGIIGKKGEQSAAKKQRRQQLRDDSVARDRFIRDKASDRRYAASQLKADRAYSEARLADERRYAKGVTRDDRAYARNQYRAARRDFVADRQYDRSVYSADRRDQQALSNKLARATAASRGIDFQRIRDDAQAAGFNPLTALQFAQNYATDVNYELVGGVYPGYGGGAPGVPSAGTTAASPGSVPVSQPAPAMAYSSPGSGYQSSYAPAFASNEFIADALESGAQAYWDYRVQDEQELRSIEQQVVQGYLDRMHSAQNPYQDFGFQTRQQPFEPDNSYSGGTLRPGDTFHLGGLEFPVVSGNSAQSAQDWFGEPGEWVTGGVNMARSAVVKARDWFLNTYYPQYWGAEDQTGTVPVAPAVRPRPRPRPGRGFGYSPLG